jgi:hypothetical protein
VASIEKISLAKRTKAATAIRFAVWMAAIGRKFVIFGRKCDVLLDPPAVLEAEAKIICPIRMDLKSRSLVIMCREGSIR